MENSEKIARIVLGCEYNITPRNFLVLLEKFGNAKEILNNLNNVLVSKCLGIKKSETIDTISLNEIVVYGEENYPKLLYQISDPPLVLFFKGDIKKINFDKCIGVVGTRKISKYGISITKGLVRSLVERGYIVVSGLAYGVDALAHQETLALAGQTIAVLGTSINDPYPQSNIWLYKKIINNSGLIFSESNVMTPYGSWIFPKRNRIIAGLCKKLVVIEAPKKSGALITANYASQFGREVYGAPGELFSLNSEGVNLLIKDKKAEILTKYEDIFENDQLVFKIVNNPSKFLSNDETEVLKLIMLGNKTVESLVEKFNYDINMLLSILGNLELNNLIEKFEDGTFMVK